MRKGAGFWEEWAQPQRRVQKRGTCAISQREQPAEGAQDRLPESCEVEVFRAVRAPATVADCSRHARCLGDADRRDWVARGQEVAERGADPLGAWHGGARSPSDLRGTVWGAGPAPPFSNALDVT